MPSDREARLNAQPPTLETIALTPDVHLDFTPGAHGVRWATLHAGTHTTEMGAVGGAGDFASVMSLVARWLLEHPSFKDASHDDWVLVGRWVLTARPDPDREHGCFADERAARLAFSRTVGR
jgi:hypothetical protein